MNILPSRGKLLVAPVKKEKQRASGFVMPDTVEVEKDQILKATIISIGNGRYENGVLIESEFSVGDEILHTKFSGYEVVNKDEIFKLISEVDVIATINEDE